MTDRCELMISEGLSLIHDPSVGEGKTRGMAKGLFLSCKGRLYAGESAGLGLPIWKAENQTIFPSLVYVKAIRPTCIEKEFRMDRVLDWYLAGKRVPAGIGRIMEHLVNGYMKSPALQNSLLKVRDMVFKVLNVHSTMVPDTDRGQCRVSYEAAMHGLTVRVEAHSLKGQGQLILLNEVDGRSFTCLRIKGRFLQKTVIPAWQAVPFDAIVENPSLGLGISVSPEGNGDCSDLRLFCGREVAYGINWAGLAIMSLEPNFTYQVWFHEY